MKDDNVEVRCSLGTWRMSSRRASPELLRAVRAAVWLRVVGLTHGSGAEHDAKTLASDAFPPVSISPIWLMTNGN